MFEGVIRQMSNCQLMRMGLKHFSVLLNSDLEDSSWQYMTVHLHLGKIARKVDRSCKISLWNCSNLSSFFFAVLGSSYTFFIKFFHAILPESKRTIIDYKQSSKKLFKNLHLWFLVSKSNHEMRGSWIPRTVLL